MRSGPPDPPSIFIGSATIVAPVGGSSDMSATFSKAGMPLVISATWVAKSFDWPWSIDGVSMPTAPIPRATSSSAPSVPRPGEVQLGDGFLATLGGAHVGLAVRVEPGATGVDQHDRALGDRAVLGLEGLDVGRGDLIVDVLGHRGADVDDEARADHLVDRDRVGGRRALGEVDRRVEVGAAVLGRREVVGGIVPAALGVAVEHLLQLEHLGGRPVDRVLVERVRQVDPPAGREILRRAGSARTSVAHAAPTGCATHRSFPPKTALACRGNATLPPQVAIRHRPIRSRQLEGRAMPRHGCLAAKIRE